MKSQKRIFTGDVLTHNDIVKIINEDNTIFVQQLDRYDNIIQEWAISYHFPYGAKVYYISQLVHTAGGYVENKFEMSGSFIDSYFQEIADDE